MSLISAHNLEKFYPDGTRALRGASFTIENGEFVAIMGPSGSGKSTLLHILGFLDRHSAGEYRFNGKRWDEYSPDDLAHVRNKEMGFVFQAFNLLARSTVLENIKLPLLYSDIPESQWLGRAERATDAVGLSHRMSHESATLSGGERQRVAIARALVNDPRIIFADEPTGNLDSQSGEVVMDILRGLNEKGKTVILITHETYTAEYAKRIIHIRDGKVHSDSRVAKRHSKKDGFVK